MTIADAAIRLLPPRFRPTRAPGAPDDHAAECVHRLAVLLEAGLAPAAAWRHLAGPGLDTEGVVREIVAGRAAAAAIAAFGDGWREVSVAWDVAARVGAPLAPALRSVAEALRDARSVRDEIRVALAEPAATGRLLTWLPLVGVALGLGLGFDTLGTLLGTPVGWMLLTVGVCLLIAGRRWTARLVRRATPHPSGDGLECELLALALSGGVSIDDAVRIVAVHAEAAALALDLSRDGHAGSALRLSRDAGVPAVGLLRAAAAEVRRRDRIAGKTRASVLGSALLLPLGVCVLPSFLVLGVAPIVLAVLSSAHLPGLVG